MTYQDWCVDTIVFILNERRKYQMTHGDQGYKYVLKAIISHYASMYYTGVKIVSKRKNGRDRLHLNLWWDHLNQDNARYFFTPLIVSKDAYATYTKSLDSTTNGFSSKKEELKKRLHLEHITPTEYIYKKLENLPEVSVLNVKRCFAQSKLILITKEERGILDGKGSQFEERDFKLLQEKFPKFNQEHSQEVVRAKDESPKYYGLGLLRMVRLYNNEVRFVCGATGKDVPNSEWLNYLNDHSNIMNVKQP